MNLKSIKDKILHQWPYKLACIVLAIVVYMLHQSLQLEKRIFTIPIQVVSTGAVSNAQQKLQDVVLTVRSDAETISTIHKEDFTAKVNLSALTNTGEYLVPIQVELNERLQDIEVFELKQKPQSIKINVEKKDVQQVLVTPYFQGKPAEGYEVGKTIITPKYIEVLGPESIVKNTVDIKTQIISLDEKNRNFSTNVKLKKLNDLISVNSEQEVNVTVEIQPIKVDKIFENIPIGTRNLQEDLTAIIEQNLVTVTINGHVNSLEEYVIPQNFAYLDLTEITEVGEYELPLQYALPSYYTLVSSTQEVVKFKIEKKPIIDNIQLNEGKTD